MARVKPSRSAARATWARFDVFLKRIGLTLLFKNTSHLAEVARAALRDGLTLAIG